MATAGLVTVMLDAAFGAARPPLTILATGHEVGSKSIWNCGGSRVGGSGSSRLGTVKGW